MTRVKFSCLVATVVVFVTGSLWAGSSSKAGTGAAVFLRDGQGARALAMGSAYTAVGRGVSSSFWNPGGMSFVRGGEVMVGYNKLIDGTSDQSLGVVYPLSTVLAPANKIGQKRPRVTSVISFQGLFADLGSIDQRDAAQVSEGEKNVSGMVFGLGYGFRGPAWGVGVNVKAVREDLIVETGQATLADIGGLYLMGDWSVGASLQHMGSKLKVGSASDSVASVLRLGTAYHATHSQDAILSRLLASADVEKPSDQDMILAAGVEYTLSRLMTLRGGYRFTQDNTTDKGFSLGLGVWTDFKGEGEDWYKGEIKDRSSDARFTMEVDYAYLMRDIFSDLHRLSLTFRF